MLLHTKEMMRLRELLDEAGVEYATNDDVHGYMDGSMCRLQTHSPVFEIMDGGVRGFSVIIAPYSYGCEDGLLEAWVQGMDEPKGWLSACDVMGLLREAGVVR